MTDLTISDATRSSVLLLQRVADVRGTASQRLATGLRVGKATDEPAAFFQAQGLRARVRDLLTVKDTIGQAESAVETALIGGEAIEALAQQLKGIALSVRGGTESERQAAAQQFDVIREQIDALANDASYSGTALLTSSSNSLNVPFHPGSSSALNVEGQASNTAGLGIGSAIAEHGNFKTDTDISNALSQVNSAISTLRSQSSSLGIDVSVLAARESFTTDLVGTLDNGAAKLVNADLNEEGARLLSTEVRQQLGIEGLRIAGRSETLLASII